MIALQAACAPAGLHYTLSPQRFAMPPILVPPRIAAQAQAKPRLLRLKLRAAPGCAALSAGFDGEALFGFGWQLRHRRLTVTLWPQLSRFTGSLPESLLDGIGLLHTTLERAVAANCLTPLASQTLLRRLGASIPLPADLAQQLVFGPYGSARQQFIDITGPVELGLTYALNQRQPGRYDLGYVARRYRFHVHDRSGRGWLQLRSAAILNAPQTRRIPAPPMALPDSGPPVYLRLFFYLRLAPNRHDVALVSASTHAALARATLALRQRPWACDTLGVPGVRCVVVPNDDTLEAEVAVRIQGRPEAVPLPATVAQALETVNADDSKVLPALRVLRPWRGREIPVTPPPGQRAALLRLVLAGGEEISW
ncbi:MAG: hypothetical protein ACRD04_14305 [Terriglobales bacterium]